MRSALLARTTYSWSPSCAWPAATSIGVIQRKAAVFESLRRVCREYVTVAAASARRGPVGAQAVNWIVTVVAVVLRIAAWSLTHPSGFCRSGAAALRAPMGWAAPAKVQALPACCQEVSNAEA